MVEVPVPPKKKRGCCRWLRNSVLWLKYTAWKHKNGPLLTFISAPQVWLDRFPFSVAEQTPLWGRESQSVSFVANLFLWLPIPTVCLGLQHEWADVISFAQRSDLCSSLLPLMQEAERAPLDFQISEWVLQPADRKILSEGDIHSCAEGLHKAYECIAGDLTIGFKWCRRLCTVVNFTQNV